MTLAVDDDFGGFVAARWPDLEAVALVATGDPVLARELTARALAGVGGRWDEVLDEGAPTRTARAALLRELARHPRAPGPTRRPGPPPVDAGHAGLAPDPGRDEDAVGRRLVEVLEQEPPLVRAAVAAEVLWQCPVAETAQLAGTAPGPLGDRIDTVREHLLTAHRKALADEGHSPADWRLDRDLADALDALADAQPDPPDPAGLVAGRARRVRRRSVISGGAALLATGTATWWVLRDATPAREAVASADAGSTLPPAGADVWASTASWPPRGALADDTGVRALVLARGRPGNRLLFADDVVGTRVVVAGLVGLSTGDDDDGGTVLQVWTGPSGAPVEDLADVALPTDGTAGTQDVVAVALPRARDGGMYTTRTVVVRSGAEPGRPHPTATGRTIVTDPESFLLVLTRPDVVSATWSPVVHPTANGSVERAWTLVRLQGGIGVRVLEHAPGSAARIEVAGYDGPVAGTPAPPTTPNGLDPVDAVTAYVAAATGEDPRVLRSEVVIDSPVAGDVLDASAASATGGDGRARIIHTTTSDGALVRTLHLADDGRSRGASRLGRPAVLPVADADAPLVQRLDTVPPRTTRYLVVAPGAAACQLIATTPAGYPVSEVTPMKADTAVVPIVNGQDTNHYRLVLWGRRGERLYSAVPPRARPLLDLWPWW